MIDAVALAPPPVADSTPAGERVLATAGDLFYRVGINRVGVDLIADTAGVTKRTLYQRFGSKDGLVTAYLDRRRHRWQTHLLSELGTADDPAVAVRTVFATAAAWARDNPRGCAFVNAWAEISASPEHQALAVIREEKRWMRRLLRQLLGDDRLAESVHLLYEGAQTLSTILDAPSTFDDAARAAIELVGARS